MLQLKRVQKKTWVTMGIALSIMLIGIGGCGTKSATSAQSSTQSSSATTQSTDAQKPTLNPAIQAAMEIRHLQSSQDMVLTSEQKTTIKPLLQSLIDTTNPSEDFLKQKAEAIEAVFTEQQKSYLSTQTQKGKPNADGSSNGNNQNGQGQPKGQTKDQPKDQANGSNKSAPTFDAQNIYKQALNSLT